MKRKVFKILISAIVFGIFVLPFSFNVNKDELSIQKNFVKAESMQVDEVGTQDVAAAFIVTLTDTGPELSYTSPNMKVSIFEGSEEKALETRNYPFKANTARQDIWVNFSGLKPSTSYRVDATIEHTQGEPLKGGTGFGTKSAGSTENNSGGTDGGNTSTNGTTSSTKKEISIGCTWNPVTWFSNCIAQFLYNIIFAPLAAIVEISAKVLDYFVYYSTNSSSYKAAFIERGWSAVRDICNIFFIITLLYIAIKTILGLNTTNNKKYIAYVIIFSLLINFSLFTTKVVIDSSNILAKIFYFQIEPKDSNGLAVEAGGQRSITVSLVQIMDPLEVVKNPSDNLAVLILVIFASATICGFMIWVFLSVALLFVSRVISLWISMIFSPVAFVSYALPFKIKQIGNEDWWAELFKNAFLAPIFIFFLYIILMFGKALPAVQTDIANAKSVADTMVKALIPFALIIVLLLKARDLAREYAGQMGEMLIKGAKAVGGVVAGAALAVATGGISAAVGGASAGMLAGGVGRSLAGAATKQGLGGFMARQGLKTLNYGAKASFDPRRGVVGKGLSNITGMNFDSALLKKVGLGTDKTKGGFNARKDRKVEKIMQEAELYKTKMTNDEVKAWSKKRKEEYDKKDEEYKKKHAPPKEYSSRAELNKDRLEEFKNKLGTSDLLGSLSYSILKKSGRLANEANYKDSEEYKKDNSLTLNDINNMRTKNLRMKIGVGAVLGTGALTGGAGALWGISGAVSGGIGAGVTGGVGGSKNMVSGLAEKEAAKKLSKQSEEGIKGQKELEKIETRENEINKYREKYEDNFGKGYKELEEKAKEQNKTLDQYIEERSSLIQQDMDNIKERMALNKKEKAAIEKQKELIENDTRLDATSKILEINKLGLNQKIENFRAQEEALQAEFTGKVSEKASLTATVKGRNKLIEFEKELLTLNTRKETVKNKIDQVFAAPAPKHTSSEHGDGGHGHGGGGHGGSHGHTSGEHGGSSFFSSKSGGHSDGHGHGGGH